MTEDEAKTKWCPQARDAGQDDYCWNKPARWLKALLGVEIGEANERGCLCVGSACAVWRWASSTEVDRDERGYVVGRYEEHSSSDGYCGLAGKP